MRDRLVRPILIPLLCAAAACRGDERADTGRGATTGATAQARFAPLPPGDNSAHADDGQWTMAAHDYANTRFSTLTQLTPSNVGNLEVAWSYTTGTTHGFEAAPLVVGDTMYVIEPYPNKLVAFDLRNRGAVKWTYEPKPDPMAQGVACCDLVNRGGAYADGKIFYATLDDHLVAVDAATGREVWKTKLGDIERGETMTMAPIVVNGLVLAGNSGGEMGVRGWLTAVDAATGAIRWRAYSTGPDGDVKIGPAFHPFYEDERGTDLGVKTWPPEKWKNGGGNVWGWISYDPELDLIYYGTANPGPWNADMRPGDNKWTAGVFARKPETGDAVWFDQYSRHDLWDHDGVNEHVLADLDVGGQRRHVLMHADRNGYLYVIDRATGEILSADPYVHITSSMGVDLKTGRLIHNPAKSPQVGKTTRDVCPFSPGGKDWNPMAFSPATGLLYIPHNNMCMDMEPTDVSYIEGTPYVGAEERYYPGPGGKRGAFTAWDPIARKKVWEIPEEYPVWSGALVTVTGVVFYGTMDGWFKAVDAKTGKELYKLKLPSGIVGQPVTFLGPDGKQYVAITCGVGGWAGAIVSVDLDPRDASAALGFVGAMRDLKLTTPKGGAVFVLSL
jgi:PQQ-dependent dehydrogenase (methanol/ethanol family)